MSTLLRKLKSFFAYDASNSSSSTFDKTSACDGNTLRHLSTSLKVNKNPEDSWIIINSIGDGAFGKMYKAQHKQCKKMAALKQVVVEDEDNIEEYCTEVKVLGRAKHKNIVDLFEAYYHESKIWMFLEYCQIGSVDSIMQELERPLNESQISSILIQLCHALTYLHDDLYIIHRDVKAANVLLNGDACVKLADFGVSAICEGGGRRNSFIGSPYWMAPEVINCETNNEEAYDFMADIWSLGIMSIEMAQMDPPWNEVKPSRVTLKILRNAPPTFDEPNKWSQEFKSFLDCCLRKDPKERHPSSKLLKHKFLASTDLSPLKELIAEMGGEVRVECIEEEEEEEDDDEEDDGRLKEIFSPTNHSTDDLEKEYYPNFIVSTNIDEEMAKHCSLDSSHSFEAPPTSNSLTLEATPSAPLNATSTKSTKIGNDTKRNGKIIHDRENDRDYYPNKSTPIGLSSDQSNDSNHRNGSPKKVIKMDEASKSHQRQSETDDAKHKNPHHLVSNNNFSFGQSSLDSRSSQFPANFSSIGKQARANQKKGKQQQQGSGDVKEGLKVALFGALATRQRLIGRSAEEGRAVELYRGDGVPLHHRLDGDSNDGDVSSVAMTTTNDDDDDGRCHVVIDDDDDGNNTIIDDEPTLLRRDKVKYKSLTKTRMYTYEGRPMTSQMSKVISQGQEERSRRDRHNKKMDMRAMQLLQLTENRHSRNLVHHFTKQTRALQKNFKASVKKCLKSYKEDLDKLSRSHKQFTIKLQLSHDQEFNEIYRRVKVQQDKDLKSLQSMLKMELKHLKEDKRNGRTTIDMKERKNGEVMRAYGVQQREHLSRLIDQSRFKHRIRQANLDNNFLVQKHDLYRACEGSIWKLEKAHLTQKKLLAIEQLKHMHELQTEQTRTRHSQELELLFRSQVVGRSDLARRHEDEERKFSKQLKQQKRQRTLLFREALNVRHLMKDTRKKGEDNFNVVVAVNGDGGYMSVEREQMKEFEREERRRIDEAFRLLRLQHRREAQRFEINCKEEVEEMQRLLKEREKHFILSLGERLKEEESKSELEHARWQQSLVQRKRILEEELERQKNQQERFFRYVLRSSAPSQHPDRRFFETYDRNFENRNHKKFVLVSESRRREFDSLDLQRPDPDDHWVESKEMPKESLHKAPLYKSTPDFISYWSGFDESLSSDEDFEDEVDSGYGHRLGRQMGGGAKKFAPSNSVTHSDDEMSTCL